MLCSLFSSAPVAAYAVGGVAAGIAGLVLPASVVLRCRLRLLFVLVLFMLAHDLYLLRWDVYIIRSFVENILRDFKSS